MIERNIKRSHPGKYLQEELDAMNMSSREFAFRTGISERTLSDLLNQKGNITFDIATKLSLFFGTSVQVWVNLQTAYDEYESLEKDKAATNDDYNLLKEYKKYLVSNKIIDIEDSKDDIVNKTRSIINVNNLSALNSATIVASFKEQNNSKTNAFAQNFWLAYALTESRKIETKDFDKLKLFCSIATVRSLTKQRPEEFYPKMQSVLADCGVSFVFIPYFPKSNLYGATKWLSSNKVMMALSNRGERADVFWFTFFHELAHVIMQHKRYCLLQTDQEDEEADKLARQIMISDKEWCDFVSKNDFSEESITSFANSLNMLPLIILGRLIKEGHVKEYSGTYKNLLVTYNPQEFRIQKVQ